MRARVRFHRRLEGQPLAFTAILSLDRAASVHPQCCARRASPAAYSSPAPGMGLEPAKKTGTARVPIQNSDVTEIIPSLLPFLP